MGLAEIAAVFGIATGAISISGSTYAGALSIGGLIKHLRKSDEEKALEKIAPLAMMVQEKLAARLTLSGALVIAAVVATFLAAGDFNPGDGVDPDDWTHFAVGGAGIFSTFALYRSGSSNRLLTRDEQAIMFAYDVAYFEYTRKVRLDRELMDMVDYDLLVEIATSDESQEREDILNRLTDPDRSYVETTLAGTAIKKGKYDGLSQSDLDLYERLDQLTRKKYLTQDPTNVYQIEPKGRDEIARLRRVIDDLNAIEAAIYKPVNALIDAFKKRSN